jgi:DNA-binding response OmpR family regulator
LLPTTLAPHGSASAVIRRILIVDGDPEGRRLLQDCLMGKGFRVQSAADGVATLEAIQAETFEGMVLGIGTPSFDWASVLRQIRRWDQQIPIVVVTASDSKESAVRAIGMGAQAYVLKPFEVVELQRVADYWFRPLERPSSESSKGVE